MRRIFFCATALWLLTFITALAWADCKPIKVRFISGPQPFTQPKVKLHIDGTKLILVGKCAKKRQAYEVPLETVTFLAHSPVRFNRAGQVNSTVPNANFPRLGSCSGLGCGGNVLAIFAWGAYEVARGTAIGVAATQHGKRHFITMDWQQENVDHELLFEVAKDDYVPLMRDIESASGKKAFDFEARWKQAEIDIQREKSRAELISLSRQVRIGQLNLPRADYSIISINQKGDVGEVYFFEGKRIDSTTLRAIAPVTICEAKASATLKAPEIDYTETTPTEIKEIRTTTRTLTFLTMNPGPEPAKEIPPVPQQ